MRDRDREGRQLSAERRPCKYFTQRFIIFLLNLSHRIMIPNMQQSPAASPEQKLDFGWTIRRFTFHQNSHGLNSASRRRKREQLSFTSPVQTLTHTLFHLNTAGEFTTCYKHLKHVFSLENSGISLFLLSAFLGFSFRLLPHARSKRVSIWLLNRSSRKPNLSVQFYVKLNNQCIFHGEKAH